MSSVIGRVFLVLVVFLNSCFAIIYNLNDTEYARMPPVFGLDDYERCLVPANGTYCLVRVDLHAPPGNDLMRLIYEYSAYKIKHYNHTYLERGVCVTTSCESHIKNYSLNTAEALTNVLEGCLNQSIYSAYGLESKLENLYYCEKKGESIEIDIVDWIVLGILTTIVLVNCIGTLYDVAINRTVRDTKGNKFLLSFSLIQNWKRLKSKESEETKAKRLTGLHGARVFTLFLMIVSHVIWVNSMGFNDNIHDFEKMYDSTYYQMIFNGLVVVQVFFVISGFLLVYNLEVYADTNPVGWSLAPKIWALRWWRLTPAYAVMLAVTTTWLRHLGSGPLWRMFVVDSMVRDCRRYWWAHLLYLNNYIDDGYFCALHTWHIATDTQLFCVGLATYLATRRGGRRLALAALMALGVLLPAAHVWAGDLDGLVLMTPEFYRTFLNDTFHHLHVYGHNNLVCYAIGMATGVVVHRLQKNGYQMADNKMCIALAWLILPSIALLFYSGSVFYVEGARASLVTRMCYAALQRPFIGVAVGYGVLGLAMRFNTVLRDFFEWRGWVVPSRLSYSAYLLHLLVIHTHIGLKTQMGHASTFNMTIAHFGVLLFTFLISLPFCLVVEAPLMALVKAGTGTPPPNETTQQTKF